MKPGWGQWLESWGQGGDHRQKHMCSGGGGVWGELQLLPALHKAPIEGDLALSLRKSEGDSLIEWGEARGGVPGREGGRPASEIFTLAAQQADTRINVLSCLRLDVGFAPRPPIATAPPVSDHLPHSSPPLSLNYCLPALRRPFLSPAPGRIRARMKLVYPC